MNKRNPHRTSTGSIARRIVAAATKHGLSRKGRDPAERDLVCSIGSEKKIRYAVKSLLVDARRTYGIRNPLEITHEQHLAYYQKRSREVRQKQLDADRKAIRICFKCELPKLESLVPESVKPRAYTQEQFDLLLDAADEDLRLCMLISWHSGLRAHEFLSLDLPSNQPETAHRPWPTTRFMGKDDPFRVFTVVGKGGLCRAVAVREAEACLLVPRNNHFVQSDREIFYQPRYELLGGQALSQRFTKLSVRVFGWSCGFHGLRHSFAQRRLNELMRIGFGWDQARQIVSCELGHFRPDITDTYLR